MDEWQLLAQKFNSQRQQQDAANKYNSAMNSYNQAQAKKTGWLESVLSGIGNSIGNVGKAIYDMGGSTIAGWGDVAAGNSTKNENSYTQKFKKSLYGGDNAKDRYAKSAGTSLDAAVTLSDLIPVAGGATKVGKLIGGAAGQIGQGALSGIAQNYIDNGSKVSLEDNLKSALVGGASAGIGQKVGGKLASKVGGDGFMSKIASNNLARGALTGAAAGATGGVLSSSLNGGDFGQNIAAGLEGAGRGAAGGATMAGTMGLAGSIHDRKQKQPQVDAEIKQKNNLSQGDVAKLEREITVNRQKQGAALLDQYGSLDAPVRRALGSPEDVLTKLYDDYGLTTPADVQYAANHVTGKDGVITKLTRELAGSAENVDTNITKQWLNEMMDLNGLTDDEAKVVTKQVDAALRRTNAGGYTDGNTALDAIKQIERLSAQLKGKDGVSYRRGSASDTSKAIVLDLVRDELQGRVWDAAGDASKVLTPDTLNSLKAMYPDNAKWASFVDDTLGNVHTGAELRSTMKPLVDGAKIVNGSKQSAGSYADTALKKATSANAKMALIQTGMDAALNSDKAKQTRANKYASRAAKAQAKLTGQSPTGGDAGTGKIKQFVNALNNNTANNTAIGDLTLGDLANRQIARQPALAGLRDERINAEMQQAMQDAQNAEDEYNNAVLEYQQAQALPQQQTSTGASNLETISNAMNAALAAGDITSYGKLADLYKQAYNIYSLQNPTETATTKDLTATQSKALTGLQQLETIKQMTPTLGTALAQTPVVSGVVNVLGGDDYANQAQALALTLGYLQSGSNVTPKEAERIGYSYVPTAYDSENTRQQKLSRAEQLLRNYLANTSVL